MRTTTRSMSARGISTRKALLGRYAGARRSQCGSPFLGPRPEHDFERPGRPMLAMKLKIGFRDMVRVGHVVVDSCSRQPVRAGPVLLSPADRGVDRYIRYVDTLRHQFSCHALRESGLGMTCHCKGAT